MTSQVLANRRPVVTAPGARERIGSHTQYNYSILLVRCNGVRPERIIGDPDSEWTRKGAILSNTTAGKEYRERSMHGSPWLRLLRREVEALIRAKDGVDYLKDRQVKTELARINPELKRLRKEIAAQTRGIAGRAVSPDTGRIPRDRLADRREAS
jgi:hypothetical protein